MYLTKVAFLLSFLALCLRPQVEAAISPKMDKYLNCLQVVTDAAALLVENAVTGIKVLADCVDFQPKIKLTGSIIRFVKLAHQFAQRAIYEKPACLAQGFTTVVTLIRPAVAKFDTLQCFDE